MTDPFLQLDRPARVMKKAVVKAGDGHHVRAHSKFSASGAERWFNCPGSVALSEGIPDKDSVWSLEGTQAHEVLEAVMKVMLSGNDLAVVEEVRPVMQAANRDMIRHATNLAKFIFKRALVNDAEVIVETRIRLDFIHPEMFGTFDAGILDHFGTLDVIDYKYGAGHPVSVRNNLQMIFYALGLAHLHHWNFKRVRMWIDQPRIKGYDGPTFWELRTMALKPWVDIFKKKVDRVLKNPDEFVEGAHCHWCKAKNVCPLKVAKKTEKAVAIWGAV